MRKPLVWIGLPTLSFLLASLGRAAETPDWRVGVADFVMSRREFTPAGVKIGVNPRGFIDTGPGVGQFAPETEDVVVHAVKRLAAEAGRDGP